jgi:hypothetical protein
MKRLLIRAHCGTPYEGLGDYVVLAITPELCDRVKVRKYLAQQAKRSDSEFWAMKFWEGACDWYSTEDGFDEEVLVAKLKAAGVFDGEDEDWFQNHDYMELPEDFEFPEDEGLARMECQEMVVVDDGVWFQAIPKHTDVTSETVRIPFGEFGIED